ncbi:MAG: alpha/beta hydrolase, partial [Dokdonella sp.]
HPGRVDKLVLVAPDGFASPGFEYGKAPAVPSIMGVMRYVLPKPVLRMNLAPSYGDSTRLSEETVTRYHDLMLAPGVRGAVLERMQQTRLQPPEPLLARIDAPVLLVWGEKDAMIPFANAADYTKNLRDSRVVSFATLGHVPQEEAPTESLPAVRAFLLGDGQVARVSSESVTARAAEPPLK